MVAYGCAVIRRPAERVREQGSSTLAHFSIANLQLAVRNGDNRALIEQEVRLAKLRFPWIHMVFFGELALFGTGTAQAVPLPGEVEEWLCGLAAAHNVWLVPGTLYERDGDHVYNTAPVIDPSGRVVARYRKMFPFLPYEKGVTPGDRFVTFDVPDVGRFGLSICYDMWFPETGRSLAALGAEVILHPSLTHTIDREAELAIGRATAVCQQCYVLDVNVAGDFGNGKSALFGPGGEIIHQAGMGREIMPIELDLAHVRRVRERGWHGLGQPLKSFRDSTVEFPLLTPERRRTPALSDLGPLRIPD